MSTNEKLLLKPRCYVEDVLDKRGIRKAKIIFDSDCNLIDDANYYLRDFKITSSTSYNTINIVARELCHFYSYLKYADFNISDINVDLMKGFIDYLKKYEKNKNKYSIENTIIQLKQDESKINNVIELYDSKKLSVISIAKIVNRVFLYLIFLQNEEMIDIEKFIKKIDTTKKRKRFLKTHHLTLNNDEEEAYDNMMKKMIKKVQIDFIKSATSSNNDYQRFLYLILELCGLRAGEALGLMIFKSDYKNIRDVKGDIEYKDGIWVLKVVANRDNPHDSLTKNNRTREIPIANKSKQEFEMVFQKYLKFRQNIIRKKYKNNSEWLFLNTLGEKLTHNTAYKRFKRSAKIIFFGRSNNLTIHSYRHFFFTNELLNGTPIELLCKLGGHINAETIYSTYIHFSGEEMNHLREKYESYYNKKIRR